MWFSICLRGKEVRYDRLCYGNKLTHIWVKIILKTSIFHEKYFCFNGKENHRKTQKTNEVNVWLMVKFFPKKALPICSVWTNEHVMYDWKCYFKRTVIPLCNRLCYGNKPSQVGKLSSCLVDFPCSWKYSVVPSYFTSLYCCNLCVCT